MDDEQQPVTITMRRQQWTYIDGTVDNAIAVAAQSGDPRHQVEPATRIREQGWLQVDGWSPGDPPAKPRQPEDATTSVTLPRASWSLIIEFLGRSAEAAERFGQDDLNARARGLADLLSSALRTP